MIITFKIYSMALKWKQNTKKVICTFKKHDFISYNNILKL